MRVLTILAIIVSTALYAEEPRYYNLSQATREQLEECGIKATRELVAFDSASYLQTNGTLIQYRTFVEAVRDGNIASMADKLKDFKLNADEILIEIDQADKVLDFIGQK